MKFAGVTPELCHLTDPCFMARATRFSKAETSALAVLRPGGILPVESLARSAGLTGVAARRAVLHLKSTGLVSYGGMSGRRGYQITDRGRAQFPAPSSR